MQYVLYSMKKIKKLVKRLLCHSISFYTSRRQITHIGGSRNKEDKIFAITVECQVISHMNRDTSA